MNNLYLDLLIEAVTGRLYASNHELNPRYSGRDWPRVGHTMIGIQRARQLVEACGTVIAEDIPGDFCECGIWRGGACILMAGVLRSIGQDVGGNLSRVVIGCDSFSGVPASSWAQDAGLSMDTARELAVPLQEVQQNIRRYGLEDYIYLIPGLFRDSLTLAPIGKLSVLRADGDLYESTWQILENLYPKLSVGGYCIIDDYYSIPTTQQATLDYRIKYGIGTPIIQIDWCGGYWRKE